MRLPLLPAQFRSICNNLVKPAISRNKLQTEVKPCPLSPVEINRNTIITLIATTMNTTLKTLKNDLYRVLVKGDADTVQMAHVFFLFAVPTLTTLLTLGKFPA